MAVTSHNLESPHIWFEKGLQTQHERPTLSEIHVVWCLHSSGKGRMALAIVRPSGCRPATIASTISGASSVMRSRRLT